MNENVKTFKNEVIKKRPSQITVLKNGEQGHVFIREDSEGQEATVLWLDNKTALEIAAWILDDVEAAE